MASSGKQPDLRLIGGIVFLSAGVPMMAANTAVGVCLMVVGAALLAGGFVAARGKARVTGSDPVPPASVDGPDAEPGAAVDRGRM
jgi:drug/metabolite transporter (DMT)-like permease